MPINTKVPRSVPRSPVPRGAAMCTVIAHQPPPSAESVSPNTQTISLAGVTAPTTTPT